MLKKIVSIFALISSFAIPTYAYADYCGDKARVKVGPILTTNAVKYAACKAECNAFAAYVNSVAAGCLARSGNSTNNKNVQDAINILVNSKTFERSEFIGVQVRFCNALSIGGAGGMVPRPGVILLGPKLRNSNPLNLSATLAHEMVHINQHRSMGTEAFECRYGEYIAKGEGTGRLNKIERAAYEFGDRYKDRIRRGEISAGSTAAFSPPKFREINKTYSASAFLEKGINYRLNDILLINGINRIDCMAACFSAKDCHAFTIDDNRQRCFLKSKSDNRVAAPATMSSGRKGINRAGNLK